MVHVTINDKELEAPEGATILEVALEAGIRIPTLCHHKDLSAYGACRLCLVEIVGGGRPGVQAACLYKVVEGLAVKTDTDRVKRSRNVMFELLLARCPESEKVRKLAADWGVTSTRIQWDEKETCVLCGLCVRACAEVSQRYAISFARRGAHRRVQTPFDGISKPCIGCGACAYVCPTGTIKIEEAV